MYITDYGVILLNVIQCNSLTIVLFYYMLFSVQFCKQSVYFNESMQMTVFLTNTSVV